MKINKVFVFLICFMFALVLPSSLSFAKPVFAAESETEFIPISELSEMDDLTKNYKLTDDIDISEEKNFLPIGLTIDNIEIKKFSGVFDGNGYTIKGLNFDNEKTFYNYGLFAFLDKATVKNLKLTDIKFYNEKVFNHSNLNNVTILAGGVAAVSEASIIENVSVSFAPFEEIKEIEEGKYETIEKPLKLAGGRVDFGGVVARAHYNTKIKNVKVDANIVFDVQTEKLEELNAGLVVADLYGSEIRNVVAQGGFKILKDENLQEQITHINVGSMAGVVQRENSKIISTYSNIVFETKNIDQEKTNKGALVGYIKENEPPKQFNISYNILIGKTLENNVATSFNQTFGKATTYNSTDSKIQHLEKDSYSIFDEKSYWAGLDNEYKWNTKTVWLLRASNLPDLQVFEEYTVELNISKTSVPLSDTSPQELLVMEFKGENGKKVELEPNKKTFRYDDDEQITIKIAIKNPFDIYYQLKSVEINSVTAINSGDTSSDYQLNEISTEEETTEEETEEGTFELTTKEYEFVFKANNFNSGEISVTLEKVVFDFVVETQNSSEGKVRKDGAQVASESIVETISAGNSYTFVAVPENVNFARDRWVIELVDEKNEPYYVELGENGKYSTIKFEFGKDDKSGITENFLKGGKLVAIFSSNVTKITFRIEEGSKGENKNAGQIFNASETTEYFSSTEKSFIKNEALTFVAKEKNGYTFVGWIDSSNNSEKNKIIVIDLELLGREDNITLTALYEKNTSQSPLTILWIVLGSVAGVAVLVVVIIVIKRKRSDYSYKNFY